MSEVMAYDMGIIHEKLLGKTVKIFKTVSARFIYRSIAGLFAQQNPTQKILLQVADPGNV
jgi:hypothetical protein